MKKIFNWTVGSFFRTIGRTIAFLVMGGLIYYILTYNDIGITDLFFDKVNASSIVIPSTSATTFWNTNGWSNFDVTSDQARAFKTIYSNDNEINEYISFGSFSGSQPQNFDYIAFQISMTYPKVMSYTNSLEDHYCSKYSCSDEVYDCNSGTCYRYCRTFSCSTYASRSTGSILTQIPNEITMHNMMFTITYTDNNTNTCFLQENEVVCPTEGKTPKQLNIYIHFKAVKTTTFDLYVSRYTMLYKAQNMQGAIENQTQQQQQQHEEIMDSNTTEAEEEATGFFEDFDVPDVGGLSGVITAPLSTIQSLLNSTCTSLVLPLPFVNEDITLPCMNSIYTEHFGAFFTIYQTIMLAIIAYRCIRSIFFDIHGFTDPNDDRIEVMDL